MPIDWFTVVAQIVNFLILVWLLKRFLYGPILRAMDERERRVTASLREADERQAEADRERLEYEERVADLERRREESLAAARAEADERRRELVAEARAEVETMRGRWLDSLRSEREGFRRDLRERAGREILAAARKVLDDLADEGLEERMAEVLGRRLGGIDGGERELLARSLAGSPAVVTSSGELSVAARERLTAAVREVAGGGAGVEFRTAPERMAGIEIKADGRKISWTVDHYLDSLERRLAEAVEGLAGQEASHG